jgi:hypothetical protein
MAVAPSHDVREADHRDGERVVLRGRRDPARLVRPCDRGGRRGLRSFGDQLGHSAGQRGQPRPRGHDRSAETGLVNQSVPRAALRDEVRSLAGVLKAKNPVVLRAAKVGFKLARDMAWDQAEDYLYAKLEQSQFLDKNEGRRAGLSQFLDEKAFRPGLGNYDRGGKSEE